MDNKPKSLIISDGKPGHLTASMGVLAGLNSAQPTDNTTIHIKLRLKLLRYPLRLILNNIPFATRLPSPIHSLLIRLAYKIPHSLKSLPQYNYVISTGGDTSFLNAWLAKIYGTKNIYCSSLRGLNASLFTLLVSNRTIPAGPNEITLTLSPVSLNRQVAIQQGECFRRELNLGNEALWAVLIGGTGSGYYWDADQIESLIKKLLITAKKNAAKLLITTSRRTGLTAEKRLKTLLDKEPGVASCTYFNHHPEKVISKFMGAASTIFCTADSSSMLSESMAMGKPVYAVNSLTNKPDKRYKSFLQKHHEQKHIQIVELEHIDTLHISPTAFSPIEHDTVIELSEKLKKRWPDFQQL